MNQPLSKLQPNGIDIATSIVEKEMRHDYEQQVDVAMEVFLVERCVALHPTSIITSDRDDIMSGRSLQTYLGDFHRKENTTKDGIVRKAIEREGISSRYQVQYAGHFDEFGRWHGRYFLDYLRFASTQLTQKSQGGLLRDRKSAEKARQLMTNDDTFLQFVALTGSHLLEQLWEQQALQSQTAMRAVQFIRLLRSLEESVAKLWSKGRASMTPDEVKSLQAQWQMQQDTVIRLMRDLVQNPVPQEHLLMQRYRPLFHQELAELHQSLCWNATRDGGDVVKALSSVLENAVIERS